MHRRRLVCRGSRPNVAAALQAISRYKSHHGHPSCSVRRADLRERRLPGVLPPSLSRRLRSALFLSLDALQDNYWRSHIQDCRREAVGCRAGRRSHMAGRVSLKLVLDAAALPRPSPNTGSYRGPVRHGIIRSVAGGLNRLPGRTVHSSPVRPADPRSCELSATLGADSIETTPLQPAQVAGHKPVSTIRLCFDLDKPACLRHRPHCRADMAGPRPQHQTVAAGACKEVRVLMLHLSFSGRLPSPSSMCSRREHCPPTRLPLGPSRS